LVRKTSVPYEILLWLNFESPELVAFVLDLQMVDVPVRVVGITPQNIGMAAYRHLFEQSRYDIITQLDDDVIRISPGIAQKATAIFKAFPQVKQLVADVWQDQWTNGSRYPMSHYAEVDKNYGLYLGMIDGWFSMYHRSMMPILMEMEYKHYFLVGTTAHFMLRERKLYGLLCTKVKVLHLSGPNYCHFFGMLDSEIEKYRLIGRDDMVAAYQTAKLQLPPPEQLGESLQFACNSIDSFNPPLGLPD
jgi:hypothetical protein